MAKFLEPVIINGINKDVAPNGLDYSGRRIVNPVRDVLNGRYLSSEGEEENQVENIKGTEIITDIQAYRRLTVNDDFDGSIDGWLSTPWNSPIGGPGPAGDPWSYGSGGARVTNTNTALKHSDLLTQEVPIEFIVGAEINISISAVIESNFAAGVTVTAIFTDETNFIITAFTVGSVIGIGNTTVFNFSRIVPNGAKKLGLRLVWTGNANPSVIVLNYFKIDGLLAGSLPDGLNECIGSYENIEKNLLIYFLWNSNGYHGVFKYDAISNSVVQLLADDPSNPVLKFSNSPRYAITGVGMIGDLLVWSDNLNPQRYINITRKYTFPNDFKISLYKIGPRKKPVYSAKQQDLTITNNNLEAYNFQFAFRYVYNDGEISVFSAFSDLMLAETIPNINDKTRAFTNVTHYVDAEVLGEVKYLQLLYRKNNDANWYIWKIVSTITSSVTEAFYNTEIGTIVDTADTTRIFDSIPNKSKAIIINRGRVFLNLNEEGFDYESGIAFSAVQSAPISNIGPGFNRGPYIKKHGKVRAAYVEFDKFGRATLVKNSKLVSGLPWEYSSLPNLQNALYSDASNTTNVKLSFSISKIGSAFSQRKSIVVSDDIVYENYFQTQVLPFFFVKDFTDGTVLTSGEVQIGTRVYLKNIPSSNGTWSKLHLLISKESPFVPDTTYSVRIVKFTTNNLTNITCRILDVLEGDILVLSDFNVANWAASMAPNSDWLLIEVFKPKEVQEPFYYEVTEPISSSVFSQEANAGHYLIGSSNGNNLPLFSFRNFGFGKVNYLQISQGILNTIVSLESPSPTKIEKYLTTGDSNPTLISSLRTFTFDYDKKAWSKGRVFVEGIQQILNRSATIRYSDPYVEGSQINGLNTFQVENVYDKIGQDRSPITKFVQVGQVMIAVHERNITTLYIGEGIVRTGETGFLTKVSDVVGDDRKLIGNMGSYHPESVQEIDGQAFGFDIFNGVIWRYTVEGIYAVSNYGMKNFFRDKARDYFDSKDELKFVSSIDRYNDEYQIVLPNKYATLEVVNLLSFATATGSYDLVLAPEDYENGKIYRLKIVVFKQTDTGDDSITFSVSLDGTDVVKENVIQIITTTVEADAVPLYVEFQYNGESFIRLSLSGISNPIFVRLTSEYQEITGETWAFNYEKKIWSHRYSYVPEFMGKIGNKVYGFKDGQLYKHNVSDVHNNFYGVQYEREITAAVNPRPNEVKVWSAIQIAAESLTVDDTSPYKVLDCSNNQGQVSYTRAKEFDKKQGIYYAPILKDVNTNPLLLSAGRIALRDGKDMRSESLEVTIRNNRTDRSLLQKINIVGEKSEYSA